MDAGIWIMTFLSVVIFDVEYGLFVGAALCIGNLLTLTMRPYTCKLALVPGTEFFLDVKRYKGVWSNTNFLLARKQIFQSLNFKYNILLA